MNELMVPPLYVRSLHRPVNCKGLFDSSVDSQMAGLINELNTNENKYHLHLIKQSINILYIHISYFVDTPQQPAHSSSLRCRMAVYKFVPILPSAPSSSLGLLGFSFGAFR